MISVYIATGKCIISEKEKFYTGLTKLCVREKNEEKKGENCTIMGIVMLPQVFL